MPVIDIAKLESGEPRPGWHDRYFNSSSMTFVHYDIDKGSWIHEHQHEQDEVWLVLEGTLEVTIDGETFKAGPGTAAVIPPNTPHSLKALTKARAIVVDHPIRNRIRPH